ncbi:tetratricopeptide repeat protein [Arthrobacter sp. AK01]|uniref:tetratricopeptide repeat protein n=1 Tax=Arthrobacter sp. AK01 TaxID=2894084 RepID=UPI001E39A029|nr:tetratricopeptide repeat protein [Arthrobacter sp. AK01]MCD4849712.1 tetratricopeptide repeat protein [Arthrobacter sp. AK01]
MTSNTARRRRLRRALWSAPPALVALAVAAKLLSVGALGGAAAETFSAKEQGKLAGVATWLQIANVVEPHKALFAAGDAHAMAGEFDDARRYFDAALQAGPGVDDCKVRVNLVLSIEKLGDSTGDRDAAALLFREALSTAEAAPSQCHVAGPANADGEGDTLNAAGERLSGKISEGASQSGDEEQPGQETPAAPQEDQLKQLEEIAQQAQRERSEGQERGEYLRSPDDGPRVDRPW